MGILLMNAQPFTVGHVHIVKYAMAYMAMIQDANLTISLTYKSSDPISIDKRLRALERDIKYIGGILEPERIKVTSICVDNVQAEGDSAEFWKVWRGLVDDITAWGGENQIRFYFCSDTPDIKATEEGLNCKVVLVDKNRTFIPVKATNIRENVYDNFSSLSPATREALSVEVVMFGAESVGKTTTAKRLQKEYGWKIVDEWARPYLESVGGRYPNPLDMEAIIRGQSTSEYVAKRSVETPVTIYDTDIISTLGYLILSGIEVDEDHMRLMVKEAMEPMLSNRYYILLKQDNIPFEPDMLRYGVTERESDDDFWENLLNCLGVNYCVLDANSEVGAFIEGYARERINSVFRNYKRPE